MRAYGRSHDEAARDLTVRISMCHVDGTVTSNSEQLMDRNRSGGTINGVGQDLDVDVRLGADHRREIWGEMRTSAVPATVFAFLTDASQMMTWLAQSAKADARPGGIFRLADLNGLWAEGTYVAATPHQRVVFTWGGIEGLRPGQSTAEFSLRADDNGTLLRLRHYGLPDPAVDVHRRGWKNSGLPKLKAVAEGGVPRGTCLGDAAESREQHPFSADRVW